MRDAGRDEHDRAGANVANLVTDADLPGPGDDVVDLVLGVRPLEIRLAGAEDIEPDAQVRDRDEFQVRRSRRGTACDDVIEFVSVHWPTIAGGQRAVEAGPHV
jgi:hypothetical protein